MVNQSRFEVRQNAEGYQEVYPTPSTKDLSDFYNNQYFDSGTYATNYSKEELTWKNIFFAEAEFLTGLTRGTVLDVGCGEGFSLNYFHKKGWDVKGVDFTNNGVKRHFSHLMPYLEVGDILQSLQKITESKAVIDLLICNNVIEHVTDPISLLQQLKSLASPKTICRFQVPNDNSWLQKLIVSQNMAEDNYWICPPGHLTYFNKDNFCALLDRMGFVIEHVMGDFPIEMFLLNPASNYKKSPQTGPGAHQARLTFDNYLFENSLQDLIKFRKTCGEIGLGRNTIVYCRLKD